MIGYRSIKDAKNGFFDRAAVMAAMDKTTHAVLSRFGAFVKRTAQLSIRSRDGSSKPGTPPHSHTGLLRKYIFFSWDKDSRSEVIGPAKITDRKTPDAPPALEYGGVFLRHNGAGRYRANYPARPFMQPALKKNSPELPGMWKDALRK